MLPTPIRATIAILGGLALAASLVLCTICLVTRPFVWVLFGFELIVLIAGFFTLGWAIRGARDGAPLALACLGGSIGVAAILGYVGTNPPVVGSMPLLPWTLGLLGVATAQGLLGGLLVLDRDQRAWGRLIRGVLLGLPVAALLAAMAVGSVRQGVVGWLSELPGAVQAAGVLVAFLLFTGLLSASVHLTIAAFAEAKDRTAT